jgi:hypothetical protein
MTKRARAPQPTTTDGCLRSSSERWLSEQGFPAPGVGCGELPHRHGAGDHRCSHRAQPQPRWPGGRCHDGEFAFAKPQRVGKPDDFAHKLGITGDLSFPKPQPVGVTHAWRGLPQPLGHPLALRAGA